MKPALAKTLRVLGALLAFIAVLALAAGGWFYSRLRASLPVLDGSVATSGLTAPVTIERDALGVPTIRGANRGDVARALGFLHAQERFFQMDLTRRRAAGELAELFGQGALGLDRAARIHGFRTLARTVLTRATPADRALLEAYAAGVNAGLTTLGSKPFEYHVLRTTPQPWQPEDCVLIAYSMALELEDGDGRYEHTLATLNHTLGRDVFAFFAPLVGPADAALDGSTAPLAPIPSPAALNLRTRPATTASLEISAARLAADGELPGSNSFALAGAHTATGAALLANDMHLGLGVPNTWYRAALVWPDSAGEHRVTGITLPGTPFMVAGSNGRIAWGFTASYADTGDLVAIATSASPKLYRAPDHESLVEMEIRHETIRVKGAAAVEVDYPWSLWGPVVGTDWRERPLAYRWAAHDPAACNFAIQELETATDVDAALAVAHRAGVPTINLLVGDSAGRIAWTISGQLPERFGSDGRLPTEGTYGDRGWKGFLAGDAVPSVVAPASGRLWTANNRILGGAALTSLGDAGYACAARAAQIRDDLAPLEHANPKDLLAVELDDRALFLARWQKLLLAALTPDALAQKKSRGELRALVEKWEGRATTDSVSYRLVRGFRHAAARRALTPIFATCVAADAGFDWTRLAYEEPLWTLLHEKPAHLLDAKFVSWEDLLLAAADDLVADLAKQGTPLANATWGRANTARLRHPFALVLPSWLTGWLNLPADPLPGDVDMPRVQGRSFGASERFAVSPGHEAEGYFHMPGGQSGHPLSPFYRAGHEAWVRGEPTPFLPGKTAHTLTLK